MIAVAALAAGIVVAVLIGMVGQRSVSIDAPAELARIDAPTANPTVPDRCRTVTTADNGCNAAWDAERRHFFREGRP